MDTRIKKERFADFVFNSLQAVPFSENISPQPSRMQPREIKHAENLIAHKSVCFSCNTTCEIIAYENKDTGKIERIEGDPEAPATKGILCSKGLTATDLIYNPERLTHPLIRIGKRGENKWKKISWEEAIETISSKIEHIKTKDGPQSLMFLEGTRRGWSRIFTRFAYAYGIMNHGAAGWAQCLWPRLVDCNVTFGAPYTETPDLKNSKAIIVWGANPPNTWPALAKEIMDAKGHGAKLIVVDPYFSESAAKAEVWVQLKPGTDTALALAMLNYIIKNDLYDKDFVNKWTVGFDSLKTSIDSYTLEWGARITGVSEKVIAKASEIFAKTKPASLYRCVAVDQQHDSVQTCRSLSILIAITGNIGIRGGNVLSSGKGDLSQNTLDFIGYSWITEDQQKLRIGYDEYPLLTQKISPVPSAHMPSLWETVITGKPYPIKGALIFGSNAMVSYTNTPKIREAMNHLEFTAVCDLYMTETAKMADIVLPASSWLERDNVISSFQSSRTALLCQQKMASVGESKSDIEIIFLLAKKLGLAEKFWDNPEEMYNYMLKSAGETLSTLKKKRRLEKPLTYEEYKTKGFKTPSGKVELKSSILEQYGFEPLPKYQPVEDPEILNEKHDYPYVMTTGGRVPFFRHSENRNNKFLRSLWERPTIFINTEDAELLKIQEGSQIKVSTEVGESVQYASLKVGIPKGVVQVIPGWEGEGNINLTVPWKNFAKGIGTVPMRNIRCKIELIEESVNEQ